MILQKNICVGGIHNTFLIIFRSRKQGRYNYEKVAIFHTKFQYRNHYGQHSVWYQVFPRTIAVDTNVLDLSCGSTNLSGILFFRERGKFRGRRQGKKERILFLSGPRFQRNKFRQNQGHDLHGETLIPAIPWSVNHF